MPPSPSVVDPIAAGVDRGPWHRPASGSADPAPPTRTHDTHRLGGGGRRGQVALSVPPDPEKQLWVRGEMGDDPTRWNRGGE